MPIVSVLQHRPSAQTKGAVQSAANWLSWVGIAAAAITQTLLSGPAQLRYGQIFWVCGTVAASVGELWAVAEGLVAATDQAGGSVPALWRQTPRTRKSVTVLADTIPEACVRRALEDPAEPCVVDRPFSEAILTDSEPVPVFGHVQA